MRNRFKATVMMLGIFVLAGAMAVALWTAPVYAQADISAANPGTGGPKTGLSVPAITASIAIPTKITAVGQGAGIDTGTACTNVTCGSGSCVCLEGTGSLTGIGIGKSIFAYELSLNYASAPNSGGFSPGSNYPTSGFVTITLPGTAGKIALLVQGNSSDTYESTGLIGFTGSFIADGGTATWAAARGTGNCSLSLDFGNTGNTTITLNGGLIKK